MVRRDAADLTIVFATQWWSVSAKVAYRDQRQRRTRASPRKDSPRSQEPALVQRRGLDRGDRWAVRVLGPESRDRAVVACSSIL